MRIELAFRALPIQSRNVSLFPFTSTGKHPKPSEGWIPEVPAELPGAQSHALRLASAQRSFLTPEIPFAGLPSEFQLSSRRNRYALGWL
jgi:hypothetical protein